MEVDHIVLWVESADRALDFYTGVLGLTPLRLEEFRTGKAPFPSVRLNDGTIFDLMEREATLQRVREFTGGGEGIGGTPINHVCLSMDASMYDTVMARLAERGIATKHGGDNAFGARGRSIKSTYFNDPDGNVLEARYYP